MKGNKKMDKFPTYLNEKQVSAITGLALPTLRNQRFQRRGVQYCKVGRSIRYNLQDVTTYMEEHKILINS